ncbi:hypothetical protein M513_13352 [Trichuris suis]|uniref:Uncharacterized protein n=1 Tax=Trichuris suis TaxID=68888 RepID=A0A085LLC8_9BILA|nr:hypothetical protein M513_13352 [Trichuris suis]
MAAFHRRRCNVKIDFSEVSDEMTVGLSEPPSSEDEEGEGQEAGNCRAIPIPDEVDGWESPTADTYSLSVRLKNIGIGSEGEGQEAGNCRAIPIPDEVDGWESPTADTYSLSVRMKNIGIGSCFCWHFNSLNRT